MKTRMKKVFAVISVCGAFIALASVYFFFPLTAENWVNNATAIAMQSWGDMFGASGAGQPGVAVDLMGVGTSTDGTASSSDLLAATNGDGVGAVDAATDDVAIETTSGAESVDNAVVSSVATSSLAQTPLPVCNANTAAASPSHVIVLNEIAWMGSSPLAGETASQAGNREWIELKNISGSPIILSGWQVMNTSNKLDAILGEGAAIPAGGFYLLERRSAEASETLPGVIADQMYSGALSNTGDTLVLFDANCGVMDRIDAPGGWPGGDNATKQTLERNTSGFGWHTSVPSGGTPRKENSIPPPPSPPPSVSESAPPPVPITTDDATSTQATSTEPCATSTDAGVPAHLVIAEIQIAGTTASQDFVKIFNPTAGDINLGGWKMRKKTKSGGDYSLRVLPTTSMVAAGKYFVWANAADGFGDAMGADATSTETLAADNSTALLNASGTVVDAVAWGEGTDQYVEGIPYPTNPKAGEVLKRKFTDGVMVDSDNNAQDFAI